MENKLAKSFEELNVYQRAKRLTTDIYSCTRQGSFSRDFGLVDQIRRSAISVLSNIAEGFERGSRAEFIRFLFISKGSCGELRAQLEVARSQDYLSEVDYVRLRTQARDISGMISNFIAHLKNTTKARSGKT